MVYSNTAVPSTTVTFNNPGVNRYIRVRSVNSCGVSAWQTKYFNLEYEPFGCSGGGIGGFSLLASPNPSDEELAIELITEKTNIEEKAQNNTENELSYILLNDKQKIVYEGKSLTLKNKINVRKLPYGNYILKVIYEGKQYTKHIMIGKRR